MLKLENVYIHIYIYIYLILAALGLHCFLQLWVWLHFLAVRGLLTQSIYDFIPVLLLWEGVTAHSGDSVPLHQPYMWHLVFRMDCSHANKHFLFHLSFIEHILSFIHWAKLWLWRQSLLSQLWLEPVHYAMWFLEDERRLCKTRFQDYCYHPILLLNCPKVFGNAVCWALVGKELALKGGVIGTNPGFLPGKGFQSTESGLSFRNKTMTRPICPSCHD